MMVSKETAWNYAVGILKVDGLTPSEEMLEMIEKEKRGEMTTDEILQRLKEKYGAT
ncbi:MAG: antitoxin VbhA family protein [Lachnospiraceae bacterium]|nr:antitoxin VbhA family protein [Lachnospiraceae bacterium]